MNDLKPFLGAVLEMRAAQKLEMDALPSNLKIWKRARQQQSVARLEEKVDELAQELGSAHFVESEQAETGEQKL